MFDHVVDVLYIMGGCRITVFFDLHEVIVRVGLADQVVVAGPVLEQEDEISFHTFFHVVVYTEVSGDCRVSAGRVLLAGAEIDALSFPESAALEAEVVVIYFAEAGLARRALQDGLRNDGAVYFDAPRRRVFFDQRRNAIDEFLRVAVGISAYRERPVALKVILLSVNGPGTCGHLSAAVEIVGLGTQFQPSGMCLAVSKVVPVIANLLPAFGGVSVLAEIVSASTDLAETGDLAAVTAQVILPGSYGEPTGLHDAVGEEEVSAAIDKWRRRAWSCSIPQFVELQRKIKRHKKAIIAAITCGLSNARIEATNRFQRFLLGNF